MNSRSKESSKKKAAESDAGHIDIDDPKTGVPTIPATETPVLEAEPPSNLVRRARCSRQL